MWNDIPEGELKQLMDEINAVEMRPDEAELERWPGVDLPLSFFLLGV